jgi:hypothetical protein
VVAQFLWQSLIRRKQRKPNGPAGFSKVTGGHEPVTTVVARAT